MATPTPKKEVNLTERDLELLGKAFLCAKEPVAIDFAKFALAASFKNTNSAKVSWYGLKKKLDALSDGSAVLKAHSGASTPSKGRKRKVAAEEGSGIKEDGNGDEEDESANPAPKTPNKKIRKDAVGKGKCGTIAAAGDDRREEFNAAGVKKEDGSN